MMDKKRFVALTSVVASGTMTVLKLIVGLMTGSLGILSEAIHSLLDLASATMTFFAVRVSDQPPDAEHPYGHGKIEALSALFATMLLVLTSFWIIWEALHRLFGAAADVEATWYAVALILLVMGVDISRSRALLKVARETGSQALEADALHYTSDILSSAAVLLGLGFVWLGWPKGDAVAALAVAVVVMAAAYHLGKAAVDVLIDTAPEGVAGRVADLARNSDGVVSVERVRARKAGPLVFVEVLLRVSRVLSLEQVKAIRRSVTERIRKDVPESDVVVYAEPLALDDESVAETVRAVAALRGLAVHDIDLHQTSGRAYLSFDVEMDEDMPIRAAHDIATELENALVQDLGDEVTVDTHIDPRRSAVSSGRQLGAKETEPFAKTIHSIIETVAMARGFHNLRVGETADGYHIAFHCTFDNELPLRDAHTVAALLEQRIHGEIEGVARVVVHAEPYEHVDAGPIAEEAAKAEGA